LKYEEIINTISKNIFVLRLFNVFNAYNNLKINYINHFTYYYSQQ